MATIAVKRCGDAVTFTDTSTTTDTACYCVIERMSEPVLVGGQITIDEDHYTGLIAESDLPVTPAVGDTIEDEAGATYKVDRPPTMRDAAWSLILRRTA